MNYLAHAFLARSESDAFRLGNLMADHIKGAPEKALDLLPPASEQMAAELLAGIRYHRRIDHKVDHSPQVAELRERFSGQYRRYAGIVLDMAWDHYLAQSWPDYSDVPLECFADQQYHLLVSYQDLQPDSMKEMVRYMVRNNWLLSYTDVRSIERSLQGMSRRMRRRNDLADAFSEISRLSSVLTESFPRVMELLIRQPLR